MGRVGLVINEAELREQINLAEASNTFKNESELFKFIASTPWGQSIKDALGRPKPLEAIHVYQRVKQFNIQIKTVKGKRGNPNIGVKLSPEQKAEKVQSRPFYQKSVNDIRYSITNHQKSKEGKTYTALTPARQNLLKRHAKGNIRAAVKLKCLECCCWEASEAARCRITGCPLYLLNPFLKSGVNPESADTVLNEEDSNEE